MDTGTDTVTVAENDEAVTTTPENDTIRIPHVLARLERYWMKNPELRLGQIIGNLAAEENIDPYFVKDTVLAEKLEEKVPSWG